MELEPKDLPGGWDIPTAAYDRYQPGLSPYVHFWADLRARRGETRGNPRHGPREGEEMPGQMREALEEMLRRSFE